MLFSALVTRYVSEKNHLEYENGKQLQVTITKIESKENKSIHRLDLSQPPLPPPPTTPLAMALHLYI